MRILGLDVVFDFWFFFGMFAQGLFFMRFVWQWIVSEKLKESVIPTAFWHLSISGSVMIGIYAYNRNDFVVLLGSILSCVIYFRNLALIRQKTNEMKNTKRQEA